MNQQVPENRKISPFLVFFLIHSMQAGIGVLGFQKFIAKYAGYDAWISIIVAGVGVHLIVWMMYKMLSIVDGDLIAIHKYVLGKSLGKWFNLIFIVYLCMLSVTVLRGFIEIIQVWMFEEMSTFWFSLVFLLLVIYILNGGFRTVTGISYFSFVFPLYIAFLLILTAQYADFTNLLPVFDHNVKEILMSARETSLSIIGFELLLFYYPFIKQPKKSVKWAHLSILFTTSMLVYIAILTFGYFPEKQLQSLLWPTLSMWKIIKMPFLERFEYIGIANWLLIILPNVCLPLWCASRLVKGVIMIRQKITIPIFALICLTGTCFITTSEQMMHLSNLTSRVGFYFNFIYIPILFAAILIAKKVKDREKYMENHS